MKAKKIITVFAGAAVVLAVLGTFAYLIAKARKPAVVMPTVSPETGDVMKVTVASGTISPRKRHFVKSRVSGVVDEIFVEPGDAVAKGAAIARIAMKPNRSSLVEAKNRLEKARLSHATVVEEKAHQENLYKQGYVSEYEYKQYLLKLENSALDLAAAEDSLRLLEEGAASSRGGAETTVVRAEAAGTVLEVNLAEGDAVAEAGSGAAGTTVAVVADMGDLIFEGSIDESEVGKLSAGLEMEITIGAIEGRTFKGTLENISPNGVQKSQGAVEFAFRAALAPEKDAIIRAGYSANAKIILDRRVGVLTLPEQAIRYDDTMKPYVEVETKRQRFERRDVTVGLSDGVKAEILGGIALDEKVKSTKYGL